LEERKFPLKTARFFFAILAFGAAGCGRGPVPADTEYTPGEGYYSMLGFVRDQWQIHRGQPYTVIRTVTLNGKKTSGYMRAYGADWASVAKPFLEADIGHPDFVGKYRFSSFADDATGTHNLFYEAIDEDLPTRTLQITADAANGLIRHIYTETERSSFWNTRVQKLYCEPGKTILIQEHTEPRIGKDKDLQIEYRFLR